MSTSTGLEITEQFINPEQEHKIEIKNKKVGIAYFVFLTILFIAIAVYFLTRSENTAEDSSGNVFYGSFAAFIACGFFALSCKTIWDLVVLKKRIV